MLRAGVVVAVATGALVGIATPAEAAPPTLDVPNSVTVRAGSTATVTVTVTVKPPDTEVTFSLTNPPDGVTCSGGCVKVAVVPNEPKNHLLFLQAQGNAPPVNGHTVTLNAVTTTNAGTTTFKITVQGQATQAPQVVPSVTGTVNDITTGKPIAGALVAMEDSAGTRFDTQASSLGRFTFTSTAAKPIRPGTLLLLADKDGYDKPTDPVRIEGRAGQVASTKITLRSLTATTAPPAATTDAAPTVTESAGATNDAVNTGANEDSGGGMLSWLLIGMGGLLVALGIGAIALLVLRRRDDGDEDEGSAPHPGPRGPSPQPGAVGVYRSAGPDPTMVPRAAAIGDRTMITRPAIADAPTAMHRPAVDEFPDPYNPHPAPGGYGPPGGGYPPPPGPQPTQYGSPQPGGYGSPVDPYARGQEYDGYAQHDDGYRQASPGYGPPAPPVQGGYAPPPNGYQQPTQYGPDPYGQGRHDQGGYDQGGYEQPPPSGYDQGGYGQPGPAQGGYDQAGYGQGDEGYDQRGYVPEPRPGPDAYDGYYDDRGQPQPGRGQRRSLDWLDD